MINSKFTATMAVQFVLLLALGSQSVAAPVCEGIFAKTSHEQTLEIQIQSLAEYRLKLDNAKAEGKSSVAISAMESDYNNKEKSLAEYVAKNQTMTAIELIEGIKAAMTKLQNRPSPKTNEDQDKRTKEEQRKTISKLGIVIDGTRGVFHPIEPGTFTMNLLNTAKGTKSYSVTLTKPYEMMATPVTQILWRKVVELAAATPGINMGPGMNPNPSQYKGDLHPVENVSSINVEAWLTALNELSEKGTPELEVLFFGHERGDKYRLPTEAEWEFVARKRGQNTDEYFFDLSIIDDYVWYSDNASNGTHQVALKRPLELGNMQFFDMVGHVAAMTSDTLQPKKIPVRGGTDPHYRDSRGEVITKGGDFFRRHHLMRSSSYLTVKNNFASPFVGFRLVREPRDNGGTP